MGDEDKAQEIQAEGHRPPETAEELKKTITIDTLHNDEALKVLANYTGEEEWTEKEEKKLVRKIDRRLLSILCLTYGLVSLSTTDSFSMEPTKHRFLLCHQFHLQLLKRPEVLIVVQSNITIKQCCRKLPYSA